MPMRLVPGSHRDRGRGVLAVLAVLAAVGGSALLLLPLTAGPAQAHNTVVRTSPAADATVDRAPSEVTVTFDQKVLALGTAVRVEGPAGQVQTGSARVTDGTVAQSLRDDAPAGDYTVTWRVTSVDGHPISGEYAFVARAGASGSTASGPAVTTSAPARTTSTATATPDATSTAAAGSDDGTNWPAVLIWGGAGAVLGALIVLVNRRRNRGRDS